jgi:hypothetical protein
MLKELDTVKCGFCIVRGRLDDFEHHVSIHPGLG